MVGTGVRLSFGLRFSLGLSGVMAIFFIFNLTAFKIN